MHSNLTNQQARNLMNNINSAIADGCTVKLNETEIGGAIILQIPYSDVIQWVVLATIYVTHWGDAKLQGIIDEDSLTIIKHDGETCVHN